ncbi:MAG: class I SAM-dependent methyltransferase [Candidatus Omnitrophica bacterium]|nr:class I SAM-dependent methyltransferase [Candidatus Omnitrophota bacterium]
MLGPFEKTASEAYRALFFNIDALIRKMKELVPDGNLNILELGCGEGMFVMHLLEAYPHAQITGVDINDRIGRVCKGCPARVVFKKETVKALAAESAGIFDLITVIDVLHHVPEDLQPEFLSEAKKALKPGGTIVIKEWTRNRLPVHLLVHLLDRFVTGDRVSYRSADSLRGLTKDLFGGDSIKYETSIGPWPNNRAFFIKP